MDHFTFHLHKRGNAPGEYEDAAAADPTSGRFAVADGATESSFAREWAKILAEGFVTSKLDHLRCWPDRLPPLQERWRSDCGGRDLPWYAEMKFEQGAFATFLGLSVQGRRVLTRQSWSAVAVGDSCLFQIRENELLMSWPLNNSADFDNIPSLLGSRTPPDEARQRERLKNGRWRAGDVFVLATDALAQWFLRQVEAEQQPWWELQALSTGPQSTEALTARIDGLRDCHQIRNDDVTLIIIRL